MDERDIFRAALEIADPAARLAWVEQACGDNPDLQLKVEALLRADAPTSQSPATASEVSASPPAAVIAADSSETSDQPRFERTSAAAEFRSFLEPSTRPGWLGRLSHYEIESVLGRGAFGIVAKAFDEKLHRVVAIKLLNPVLASGLPPRLRFLREARSAAAITHENVVAIYAVEEGPLPYLVMEYVPGQTLEQRMTANGPFDVDEILRIGQQLASGLAAAHRANVIHRDIKPANILLADGPVDRVKISDFGLARTIDDASMTSTGLIIGTPMYMAPEQAAGEPIDHRADLFSLGCVLYQMASGRLPFRAANTLAVLKRICEDEPQPVDAGLVGFPDWLQRIIFRLLEKRPEDRFQTASEVAQLLSRHQQKLEHTGDLLAIQESSSSAETKVCSPFRSTGPKLQRRPFGWVAGGVLAVAVLSGLFLFKRETEQPHFNTSNTERISAATALTSPSQPDALIESTDDIAIGLRHGRPADAPRPAIAPFDAVRARRHQEDWAAYLKVPVEYTNSIGMTFRLIPAGEFIMGSAPAEIEAALKQAGDVQVWQESVRIEAPHHRVILTRPVYLGVTEVTQAEYQTIQGNNPSVFCVTGEHAQSVAGLDTARYPVEMVSWNDAVEFCAKLSEHEQLLRSYTISGKPVKPQANTGYRLPSEAEWEFACRAGTTTKYWFGDHQGDLLQAGWYWDNSSNRTHAVGELEANPFGLSDVHGNVWEWVEDGYDPTYYSRFQDRPAINPQGPFTGASARLMRGGNQWGPAFLLRSATRGVELPSNRQAYLGFRVALPVDAVRQDVASSGKNRHDD